MDQPKDIAPSGLSLQELFQILSRRRVLIVQAFVVVSAISVAVTLMTRSVYQSKARLLVEATSSKLSAVDASNPISELLALTEPQSAETQVEVLQSPSLIRKVADETGVADTAIKVSQVGDTNVIEATAESVDPRRAALAANRLLSEYLSQDVERNLTEIKNAEAFAQQHGDVAKRQLDQVEADLAAFKEKHRVAELTEERQQQIDHVAALQSLYEQQNEALAAMGSQITAEQALLAQQPATEHANSKVTNPDLANVRARIADLKVQREAMLQPGQFTVNAPEVQNVDAQIAALKNRLNTIPALIDANTVAPNPAIDTIKNKIIDLKAQQKSLSTQVASIQSDLHNAQARVGHFAGWEVTLERLSREHDQAAEQYKMFQEKLADLSLREKSGHASGTVIETATPSDTPVRPKRLLNIILGCLFGLVVGISLALLQEYLDDKINTPEEADRLLEVPSLGYVPNLSAADAKLLPLMDKLDPAAESYRILRTNIHFASIDNPVRTLLVTSSSPGEGKTTTAANLAFAMALDGKRVIIVDTDLRRPSLQRLLSLPPVSGLTEVLLGHVSLDEALINIKSLPNLMALTAGYVPPNPGELLNSRTFRTLINDLRERADIVIFDSSPVLIAADAAILASELDGTIMVLEVGRTKKAAAQRALGVLLQARSNVLGIAYNKMRALDGGYYYYSHYSQKYTSPAIDTGSKNGNMLEIGAADERSPREK